MRKGSRVRKLRKGKLVEGRGCERMEIVEGEGKYTLGGGEGKGYEWEIFERLN